MAFAVTYREAIIPFFNLFSENRATNCLAAN